MECTSIFKVNDPFWLVNYNFWIIITSIFCALGNTLKFDPKNGNFVRRYINHELIKTNDLNSSTSQNTEKKCAECAASIFQSAVKFNFSIIRCDATPLSFMYKDFFIDKAMSTYFMAVFYLH